MSEGGNFWALWKGLDQRGVSQLEGQRVLDEEILQEFLGSSGMGGA